MGKFGYNLWAGRNVFTEEVKRKEHPNMTGRQGSHGGLSRREILKRAFYGSVAAGLSGGLWLGGCAKRRRSKNDKRPNVLMISLDTVRRDHCSVYGYKRDTTPNLRLFADQGTSFDLAYAPTSTTGPSHATMFTSLYPVAHGVIKNGLKLSPKSYTLAKHLSAHGYQTAAVVSSFVLDAKYSLDQGFTFYDDDFELAKSTIKLKEWKGQKVDNGFDQRADDTTEKVIGWLSKQRDPDRPFFLFVHYWDPHSPYIPPRPFLSRFAPERNSSRPSKQVIRLYDGEIAFVDSEIGRLFAALKKRDLEENTLVVVTSDHGEGLFQHDHISHSINIYEEAVRVPLLLRWPHRIVQGQVCNAPVELLGLAPTILDMLGVKWNGCPFEGQSLAAALRGESQLDLARPVYLYRQHYKGDYQTFFRRRYKYGIEKLVPGKVWMKGEKFGIRAGTWKYIEGLEEGTKELFDLSADPGELTNLYTGFPKKAAELASQLEQFKQSHISEKAVPGKISKEDLERLKSLGYIE